MDGGALSLLFDAPLMSFRPAKPAEAYHEIKIAIRLKTRPIALIVAPRFTVTRIKAAVLLTMNTAGVRETVDIQDNESEPRREWNPRYLLPATLLTGNTITLTIAFEAQTLDEIGEVQVALDSIDFQVVSPTV
jgi:hypothetical protein